MWMMSLLCSDITEDFRLIAKMKSKMQFHMRIKKDEFLSVNIRAFRLSFKNYLTLHQVLLANSLLELLLVQNIRITGHVFDHFSDFRFRKQPEIFCIIIYIMRGDIKGLGLALTNPYNKQVD